MIRITLDLSGKMWNLFFNAFFRRHGLPWLYITNDNFLLENDIDDDYELYSYDRTEKSVLSFLLIKYAYDGTYLGEEILDYQMHVSFHIFMSY